MSLAPWRSAIARSLHINRSHPDSRFFQLATISLDGYPANRTVVFRGFRDDSNDLQIISDSRSEKNAHLQEHPQAEICWYFTKSREQFRFRGIITVIDAQNTQLASVRETVWEQISDSSRSLFFWPDPKAKRTKDNFPETPPVDTIPETFTVLLFSPEQVDYLTLKGDPQNRYLYVLEDAENWSMREVNP